MNFAIDELERSIRYHIRQHEENVREIQNKRESIEMLEEKNEQHLQIVEELKEAIERLKQD
jgi:predicted RNase H-like nuclease (RuvC/YqgF family)